MEDENELIALRRKKLETLRARGIEPFGTAFDVSGSIAEVREQFKEDEIRRVAGRITAHRDMGKSHFLDLRDVTGRIQIYIHAREIGPELFELFRLLDIGDFIGVEGTCFVTKSGEPTVKAQTFQLLSKTLRPLPEKWHGLQDIEARYRAEPFKTHHNALGIDLYLRIALELYLKRLLVAGFNKVFEINRNFRNEGISRKHNPEFTMLEAYWAYADFERIANLVEELICYLAEKICGSLSIEHRDADGKVVRTINLKRPWRRVRYRDLMREVAGEDWFELPPEQRRGRATNEFKLEILPQLADFEVTQHVFEKLIEEKTMDPLFVTHCPKELVPLAKQNAEDSSLVDVFELVINGVEIAPGYSELNDPLVQRQRLLEQAGEEKQNIDEEFLLALEYGMPPAGGFGIGIDRLTMLLTGAESIRDVILFPLLRPKKL